MKRDGNPVDRVAEPADGGVQVARRADEDRGEARLEDFDDREREDHDHGAPQPAGDSRAHAVSFGGPRRRPARSGRRLPAACDGAGGTAAPVSASAGISSWSRNALPGSGLERQRLRAPLRRRLLARRADAAVRDHDAVPALRARGGFPASRASATSSTPQVWHAMRMFWVSGLRGFLGGIAILFTRAILKARARKSKCDRETALRCRSFHHESAWSARSTALQSPACDAVRSASRLLPCGTGWAPTSRKNAFFRTASRPNAAFGRGAGARLTESKSHLKVLAVAGERLPVSESAEWTRSSAPARIGGAGAWRPDDENEDDRGASARGHSQE